MLSPWTSRILFPALVAGVALFLWLQNNGPTRRVLDENFILHGHWDIVDLASYSSHRASFTHDPQASLTLALNGHTSFSALTIHLYNYGDGSNRFSIRIDDDPALVVTQAAGAVGEQDIRVMLPRPKPIAVIGIQMIDIGQPSFLIDHIDLDGKDFPYARLGVLAALAVLLAIGLQLSGTFVVTHTPSSGQTFHFIDVLRGVAVLLVVLFHARGYSQLPMFPNAAWFNSLVLNGRLGVEIFYFVSAFTLTFSQLADRQPAAPISSFWLRRVARIMPVFLVVILLLILARPWLYPDAPPHVPGRFIVQYIFMAYIFQNQVLNFLAQHSVLWSISTEFQFYILMPALFFSAYFSLRQLNHLPDVARKATAAALFCGGIAMAYLSRRFLVNVSWSQYLVLYHIDMFAAGIALALVMPKRGERNFGPSHPALRYIVPAAWLGALLVLIGACESVVKMFLPSALADLTALRAVLALGLAAIVYLARWGEDRGWGVAADNPLRTIGVLSFILYLLHVPALQIVQRYFSLSAFASSVQVYGYSVLLALVMLIPASLILHRLVEAPCLNFARHPAWEAPLAVGAQVYLAIVAYVFFISAAIFGSKG
jgi:peptidoglycan/LPS O-acetylase OafA/YrhL